MNLFEKLAFNMANLATIPDNMLVEVFHSGIFKKEDEKVILLTDEVDTFILCIRNQQNYEKHSCHRSYQQTMKRCLWKIWDASQVWPWKWSWHIMKKQFIINFCFRHYISSISFAYTKRLRYQTNKNLDS